MDRRVAAGVVVSLAILLIAAAFAYPLSPSPAEHDVFEAPNASDMPDSDGFRLTASISSGGETTIGTEAVVVKDGARYGVLTSDGNETVTEMYQPSPDGVVYERTVADEKNSQRRLENVREDDTRELLRYENRTDGATIVAVDSDEGDVAEDIEGSASMYINNLYAVGYEEVDSRDSGDGGVVYEPRGGWFNGVGTYHATDVSGEVRTDDDGAVRHANVTWRSWRVENYAYYVLANLFTEEPEKTRTTLSFDAVEDDVEVPDWVERAR